jgi:hypothetical protein
MDEESFIFITLNAAEFVGPSVLNCRRQTVLDVTLLLRREILLSLGDYLPFCQ